MRGVPDLTFHTADLSTASHMAVRSFFALLLLLGGPYGLNAATPTWFIRNLLLRLIWPQLTLNLIHAKVVCSWHVYCSVKARAAASEAVAVY